MDKRPVSRRTVLRGVGAAVALLASDAGAPALASSPAVPPRRMAFIYVPNGVILPDWTPKTEGAGFAPPSILEPMTPFKNDFMVISGLTCDKARANGDGAGDHARASAAFLTGTQARKTAGANMHAGVSVDQVAAARLGDRTRPRSKWPSTLRRRQLRQRLFVHL